MKRDDPEKMKEAMKKLGPAVVGLGKSAGKALQEKPEEITRKLNFKKKKLGDDLDDLDKLKNDIDRLRKKFADPNYIPTPEEKNELADAFKKFRKVYILSFIFYILHIIIIIK